MSAETTIATIFQADAPPPIDGVQWRMKGSLLQMRVGRLSVWAARQNLMRISRSDVAMTRRLSTYPHRLVRRVTSILSYLGTPDRRCRLTEIANAVDLDTGTTYRLLSELVREGFVYKDGRTRTYSTGYEVFRLGESVPARAVTVERGYEHLQRLALEINATIVLGSREGREVYLHKLVLRSPHEVPSVDTTRTPFVDAHATAVGKVLLAFSNLEEVSALYRGVTLQRKTNRTIQDVGRLMDDLQMIRRQGFATDLGEYDALTHGIGIPIFSPVGRVNLALWLITNPSGFPGLASKRTVSRAKATAAALIQEITGRPSLVWSAKQPGSDASVGTSIAEKARSSVTR